MTPTLRPAVPGDLAAITALQDRYDTHWLGAPERDESEMAEELGHAAECVVVEDGGELVAASWIIGLSTSLTLAPGADVKTTLDVLLPWLTSRRGTVAVLDRDEALRRALLEFGWTHDRSAFELLRPVTPDWHLDEPRWPEDVQVTDFSAATPEQVHELIYVDACWADVTGHMGRTLPDWVSIFVTDKDLPEQQVLAWRDGRLVGAATGRIFADGSGWVAQLAVARSERRRGLGQALLLEAFRRRVAAGATTLGLGVQAENVGAIALYTGIGLIIDREWQIFAPPS